MRSSPALYGKRSTAAVSATYSASPTSAMPNGEFRFCRKTLRVSAMPSPSASRSSVLRLALGAPAPAREKKKNTLFLFLLASSFFFFFFLLLIFFVLKQQQIGLHIPPALFYH